MINVTRSSMPSMEEYMHEIEEIWDSHWLTNMGTKHELLRRELRDKLEVQNVELFTNGHMALELSLQALSCNGGEVITSPFTFASTTHAIVRNGLVPVFCDINENDYTIDADKIENLITDKTVAIMPIHVYGNICEVDKIQRIADAHGLKVIYDAAHAFAEKINGISIALLGDVACFSFHATKAFNTIEGGAACYRDESFGDLLYMLKNFGITGEEAVEYVGTNAKMNEFCAAMGLCNLRHLDDEIAKREKVYQQYINRLNGVKGITINYKQDNVESNYSYFPILVTEEYGHNRDELASELKMNEIYARKYFYPLTSEFSCYKERYNSESTPIAQKISKQVLTLPMYADLSESNVNKICDVIQKFKY